MAFKLDNVNDVTHSAIAASFAAEYAAAKRGDFRASGPTKRDEQAAERFAARYSVKTTRKGFAGSGTDVYTDALGNAFEVDRSPNGRTFHGTTHHVECVRIARPAADVKHLRREGDDDMFAACDGKPVTRFTGTFLGYHVTCPACRAIAAKEGR